MKKIIRASIYLGAFICLSIAVLSCEEDFTNIDSDVLRNTQFSTNSETIPITAENSPLERVQTDNISRNLGQYLLGIYASSDYEKLEASIVSQLSISTGLQVIDDDNTYEGDTIVVTKMDTVFLKIPYQVVLNEDGDAYELDSIIGEQDKEFTLNVYRNNTFINQLNPSDPTKLNSFFSDATFEKIDEPLNASANLAFKPNVNDTALVIKRRLYNDAVATQDTLQLFSATTSTIPIPFIRIPLDEDKFRELFLEKYETGEFDSQAGFNDYFRGIIIEATGTEGSLISLSFSSTNTTLRPSIEAYYTNTVLISGTTVVIDTITKNNSFPLDGFRVNTFKMDNRTYPNNDEIIIQGTAGSEGTITLFDQAKIDQLRANNWLINDASLTFYINQSADTAHVPDRLYLYRDDSPISTNLLQITDAYSENAFGGIAGQLERDADGRVEKYTFKITDYISEILSGELEYTHTIKLKAFNPTDLPTTITDIGFSNFSWNPKAVTLHTSTDTDKKAVLKISYSEKNN